MSNMLLTLNTETINVTNDYLTVAKEICGRHGWKPSAKNVNNIMAYLILFQGNLELFIEANKIQKQVESSGEDVNPLNGKIQLKEDNDND